MRKILSFLMMTLFSVSMFAAEPVSVKSTFTKATKPENDKVTDLAEVVTWDIATTIGAGEPVISGSTSNTVECLKFGNSKSVYFSKVEFSTDYYKDYNVTSVKFGVVNNGKKTGTFTAKQGETTIGSESKEFGNTAWEELTATGTKGEGGTLTVTYEVAQAFYLSYIEVTYEEESGETPEPEPTTKTVYCKVAQDWWKADGAATGIYAYATGDVQNAAWPGVRMTAVEGETDLWKADIDTAKYDAIIFTRVNATGDIADWGAKTADLVVPADKDLYTITSTTAVWGNPGVTGTWSVYGEEQGGEEPEQIKYYMTGEKATNWVGGWEPNDTPMHGDSAVFKGLVPGTRYQFKITGGSWGNNEKGFSSVNQASKDAGIYTTGDGGNIMFYMNKTGDVKVKVVDDLINVEGDFVHYFLAGNGEEGKAWAGGKGWWQDVAPLAGDSIVYDNLETEVTYEFKVLKYASWDNTMNINNVTAASKALGVKGNDNITFEMAEAGKVVIRVVGDSVALTGNFVKPAEPADPVYAISGAWNNFEKDIFVVAEDKKTASFSIDLEAGDYEFKIRKDDAWLTKANEGNAYGLHREWTGVAGVTDEATENIKLTADENGVYTFVWTFANDSIGVNFPAKHALNEVWKVTAETAVAAETKYVDNYALAISTVYAGTLKTNARQFGGYAFTHVIQVRNAAYPSAENVNGTEQAGSTSLVMTAKENVEVTLFYNRQTGNEAENDSKDIIVYDQADLSKLTGAFAMVPSGTEGYFNTTKTLSLTKGHVYTVSAKGTTIQLSGIRYISDAAAPVVAPAKFYITGDSALVVNAGLEKEKAWAPNAIKSEEVSYKLTLAAGDYMLKITLDGTWETVKGYDALTTVAAGLTRGEGANNDNICFTLAEAGEVTVTYTAEVFTVTGNFYATPAVEDGYYLVGKIGGADQWSVGDLTAEKKFAANEQAAGEYVLSTTLAEGDAIKVVKVENNAIVTWYNDGGDNYAITADLAGKVVIYFRPEGNADWGYYYFTVVKDTADGMDNISNDEKAVKVVRDGQFLIIKNGKTYTVQGREVR